MPMRAETGGLDLELPGGSYEFGMFTSLAS